MKIKIHTKSKQDKLKLYLTNEETKIILAALNNHIQHHTISDSEEQNRSIGLRDDITFVERIMTTC